MDFPHGSDSKESTCSVRVPGLIPGSGRSFGEGNDNPLQDSCLENSMNRGAWWATVRGVAKESDTTEWLHFHFDTSVWASQMVLLVKNPPANAGDIRDLGSVPGLGRSPGEGNGYPFQYSCLENPMDRGAWWAAVHRVAKSRTWLNDFIFFLSVGKA